MSQRIVAKPYPTPCGATNPGTSLYVVPLTAKSVAYLVGRIPAPVVGSPIA